MLVCPSSILKTFTYNFNLRHINLRPRRVLLSPEIEENKRYYVSASSQLSAENIIFYCIKHKPLTSKMYKTNNVILSVEIKYQLDATDVFIADLIAYLTCFGHHYAHHQELRSIIQWLLSVAFRAAASCKPDT